MVDFLRRRFGGQELSQVDKPPIEKPTPPLDSKDVSELGKDAMSFPYDYVAAAESTGEVSTVDTAAAAARVAAGNLLRLNRLHGAIDGELGDREKTETDAERTNRTLRSTVVSNLLSSSDLWTGILAGQQNLFSVLDPALHTKLDAVLSRQLSGVESDLTPETKQHLLSTVATSEHARGAIFELLSKGQRNLLGFLQNSKVVEAQLAAQGITDPQAKAELINSILPIVSEAVLHLSTISQIAERMSVDKPPLAPEEAANFAVKLLPIVTSNAGKALLKNPNLASILSGVIAQRLPEQKEHAALIARQAALLLGQVADKTQPELEELIGNVVAMNTAYSAWKAKPNLESEAGMRQAAQDLIRTGNLGLVVHALSTDMAKLSPAEQTKLQQFLSDTISKTVEEKFGASLSDAAKQNMTKLVSTMMSLALKLGSSEHGAAAIDQILEMLSGLANPDLSTADKVSYLRTIESKLESLKDFSSADAETQALFKAIATQVREIAKSYVDQVAKKTHNPSLARTALFASASASSLIEDPEARQLFLNCATAHANGDEGGLKEAAKKLLQSKKLGAVIHDFAKNYQKLSVSDATKLKNLLSPILIAKIEEQAGESGISVSENTKSSISNLVEVLMKLSVSMAAAHRKAEQGTFADPYEGYKSDGNISLGTPYQILGTDEHINQILETLPNLLEGSVHDKIKTVEDIMAKVRGMATILSPDEINTLKTSLDSLLQNVFSNLGLSTLTPESASEISSMLLNDQNAKKLIAVAKYQSSDEHGAVAKFFNRLGFVLGHIFSGRLSISTLLSLGDLKNKVVPLIPPNR